MESHPIELGPFQSVASYQNIAGGKPQRPGQSHPEAPQQDPEDIVSIGDGSVAPEEAKYFTKGNKVSAFMDKEIFDEAKEMVRSAKSRVQLEMYSFTNQEMTDLLVEEAKKGIKVQVILDPTPGTSDKQNEQKQNTIDKLKAAGVDVVMYPVDEKKKQIDHVKLLIVDGKSVLMGGMNWGEHSPYNHDADFKIEGPAVNTYERIFAQDWKKSGGKSFKAPEQAKEVEGGDALVNGVGSEIGYNPIMPMLMRNIEEAKESIHAEMFVLSDKNVIQGLIDAHNRGVDVKVLLDPNGVTSWNPNGKTYETLKEAGVPVKWYDVDTSVQQKLHAKWGVFDGKETINGSANWSYKGLHVNRELAADVVDKKTATVFEKQFQDDWENHSADKLPFVPDFPDAYEEGHGKKELAPKNE